MFRSKGSVLVPTIVLGEGRGCEWVGNNYVVLSEYTQYNESGVEKNNSIAAYVWKRSGPFRLLSPGTRARFGFVTLFWKGKG
jgi:hypothetical protein